VEGCFRKGFKGEGNLLGGFKEGDFKKIGIEEERVWLCWHQMPSCSNEILILQVGKIMAQLL